MSDVLGCLDSISSALWSGSRTLLGEAVGSTRGLPVGGSGVRVPDPPSGDRTAIDELPKPVVRRKRQQFGLEFVGTGCGLVGDAEVLFG